MALDWKNLGVTVQGIGHERYGAPGEDKVSYVCKENVSAIALCDGVGSAIASAAGAELFSEQFCQLLTEHFDILYEKDDATLGEVIIQYLIQRLKEQFGDQSMRDYAATLLGLVVKDDDYLIVHLGDGLIGCLSDNSLKLLSDATNFEYANVTVAVTSPNASQHIHINRGKTTNIQSFFLMSDGSEASLYHRKEKTFSPILIDIINLIAEDEQEAKEQLEELMTFRFREHTLDDCSLNFLVRSTLKPVEIESLENFLVLSETSKHLLLSRLEKQNRKHLSVTKLEAILNVFHDKGIVTKTDLKQSALIRHERSLNYILKLLLKEGIIAYQPSTNHYYLIK